ncbi:MAG: GWxTD domain-containing protein, partial [Thermoanaerobaculia bacterium]|nr:GWxTD domain-containing protein [Thermoanaerobaculia bacterium]
MSARVRRPAGPGSRVAASALALALVAAAAAGQTGAAGDAEPEDPPPREAPSPEATPEPAAPAATDEPGPAADAVLADRFEVWLSEVEPLILTQERRVFLSLKTDYQREAFIDRFWRVRDPYPKTARNELKVRYTQRLLEARGLFRTLEDDRSRIFLVHGPPTGRVEVKCSAAFKPVEVWLYEGSEQVAFSILLIFVVPRDDGPARLWHPKMVGGDSSIQSAARCINGEQAGAAAATIRSAGLDWELGFRRMLAKPLPSSQEWLATFQALSTELPPEAATFAAELALEFPARYQQRTVVQGLITVPREEVVAGDSLGFRSYNFDLTGEVVLDDELFENFRYKFTFSEEQFGTDSIPLAFQRYLRPGSYRLIVKLADTNGERYFRLERPLEVPRVEGAFERPAALASEASRRFAEATAALARGETSIQIVPPRRALQRGFVRFDTLAVGDEIDRVAFLLDRRPVATKTRPPWNVEIDLGDFPRPHTLRVEALDDRGVLLAWDELEINVASQAFGVRLLEPRRGVEYRESLLASARV